MAWSERRCRDSAEEREVGDLLRRYDVIVARLTELGVDVKARDRGNAALAVQHA